MVNQMKRRYQRSGTYWSKRRMRTLAASACGLSVFPVLFKFSGWPAIGWEIVGILAAALAHFIRNWILELPFWGGK